MPASKKKSSFSNRINQRGELARAHLMVVILSLSLIGVLITGSSRVVTYNKELIIVACVLLTIVTLLSLMTFGYLLLGGGKNDTKKD